MPPARTVDGLGGPTYRHHQPEKTLLYQIITQYYPVFRESLEAQGRSLPNYVQREFEEFLEPLEISQKALAAHLNVPVQRISEIVRGKRGITPGTAWLLSEALNTSPEFWLNLQSTHDLSAHRPKHHVQPLVALSA